MRRKTALSILENAKGKCLFLEKCLIHGRRFTKMNKIKLTAEISFVLLVLAAFAPLCAALETNVQTVADRTLTLDLGPDFSVGQSSTASNTAGYIQQNVTIVNNGYPQTAIASIMVLSFYGDYAKVLDPVALSGLMEKGILDNLKSSGDSEIGNWTTTSKIGQNVTVHSLAIGAPGINSKNIKLDFAFWHLDRTTYVAVISALDRNTTDQIIRTTAMK